jgi:hypothetical protein
MTSYQDDGHTVERCKSGLGASITLQTVHEREYTVRERYWRAQLAFALERQTASPYCSG